MERNTYKIVVTGVAADMMMSGYRYVDAYVLDEDTLFMNRKSPIVYYADLTDSEAITLAQQEEYEVTRARADWSI